MTVHLVGAGPGDPELLTLKAARLLAEADAVVYDRLVDPRILELMNPAAERYDVGKTPDRPSPAQEDISELLVVLGRRLDVVVRLKGGDPFVFGRGGEEADRCVAVGIPVAVVPGVTSSVAGPAAAGIAVTRRGFASGVCIVTAHQDPDSPPVDWDALARCGLTLVVLMGARRAGVVRDSLLAGGLPGDTPVAVVTRATLPTQEEWHGTLGQLGRTPVAAPSVLVIGPAAAARIPLGELLPTAAATAA